MIMDIYNERLNMAIEGITLAIKFKATVSQELFILNPPAKFWNPTKRHFQAIDLELS